MSTPTSPPATAPLWENQTFARLRMRVQAALTRSRIWRQRITRCLLRTGATAAIALAMAMPQPAQAAGTLTSNSAFNVVAVQSSASVSAPDTAMDADGDYVVVWQERTSYSDPGSIQAQRYDEAGQTVGNVITVSTGGEVESPAVAMDDAGNFVVVWLEDPYDDGYTRVRTYDSQGNPGPVSSANPVGASVSSPDVAMDADGDFVVTWDEAKEQIQARAYNAQGNPVNNPETVATATGTDQVSHTAVAMDADGDFMVTWRRSGDAGSDDPQIEAQRFTRTGATDGALLEVANPAGNTAVDQPDVALDADGNALIVWQEGGGPSRTIRARQYNGAANPAFDVTTTNANEPAVAMDADGDFIVAWTTGYGSGIEMQRYNRAAQPQLTDPMTVNADLPTGSVFVGDAALAMDDVGDFVIAWKEDDFETNPSTYSVDARQYRYEHQPEITTTTAPLAYAEDDPATPIDPALTVVDGNDILSGATVQITGGYVENEDLLAFSAQSGITGSFDPVSGTLTLSGNVTPAAYQAALRSVTYRNLSNAPSIAPRVVTFRVDDGTAQAQATRSLNVAIEPPASGQINPNGGTVATGDSDLEVTLPGGAVGGTEPYTVTVTKQTSTPPKLDQTLPVVQYFTLAATRADGRAVTRFSADNAIAVTYTDADLAKHGITDESSLLWPVMTRTWSSGCCSPPRWMPAATRQPAAAGMSARLCC
ncbi:MAG: hypothetical protein ACLFVO_00120 [Chloroflexaceae bacterium]